ncbi:MAG: TonB-dependent receptor, partial [Cytophagaceae bacterium]|nr:TonB-dependent receptor [Cytophagaceae bacterium]
TPWCTTPTTCSVFFSTFNADAIKRIDLFKGAFPARYGGRLSSVVDVQMKEGNREGFHGSGGIGLLSSRLTLEGPLKKGVSSFLISGRRTYADLFMGLIQPADSKILYGFYDVNAKINLALSAKHTIFLSAYTGRDRLRITERVERSTSNVAYQNGLTWGNLIGSLRWNAVWGAKTFSNLTLTRSQYRFALTDRYENQRATSAVKTATDFLSTVSDWTLKADFDHFYRPGHTLRWGGVFTRYRFVPRSVTQSDSRFGTEVPSDPPVSRNVEGAVYAENESRFGEKWTVSTGVRLGWFGLNNRTYVRPEPRLALAYRIRKSTALKASYVRMNQYVHQLSNTGVGFPTDLWVPTAPEVPPQQSDQVALGLTHDVKGYSFTLEGYHKWMRNVINYREGANFIGVGEEPGQSTRWEDHVVSGSGWAYGFEAFAQKQTGRLTGWLGYTLAWSVRQFDEINGGRPFYARQDRWHDVKVVGSYTLSPRIAFSANWQFSTGNALSVPAATYFDAFENPGNPLTIPHYGLYNGFRTAPYHRLDVGVQFIKKKSWGERTWEVSVFNAYNRQNPYFYSISKNYDAVAQRSFYSLNSRWLLPILPSVSYGFKF